VESEAVKFFGSISGSTLKKKAGSGSKKIFY